MATNAAQGPGSGRPRGWVDPLIFVALAVPCLAGLIVLSLGTPIAGTENQHFAAARSLGLWLAKSGDGQAGLLSRMSRDASLGAAQAVAALPHWISAAVWQSFAHKRVWLQEPFAFRSGFLLLSALSPALQFLLVRKAWGRRAALLGSLLLIAIPSYATASARAELAGPLTAAWLVLLLVHDRSLRSPSFGWTAAAAVLFSAALSLSFGMLAALFVWLVHTLATRWTDTTRLAPQGLMPFPRSAVFCALAAPAGLVAFNPWLWSETGTRFGRLLTGRLASAPARGGPTAGAADRFVGIVDLFEAVPTFTWALAAVGAVLLALAWRRTRESAHDASNDPPTLGALLVCAGIVGVLWIMVAPLALRGTPPHWTIVLPTVAALGGYAIDIALRALTGWVRRLRQA